MYDIVFDLEWNMGYPQREEDRFDEIVEIGAVKVEDWRQVTDTYRSYVRPSIHRALHHHVRKMLPFTKAELKLAGRFPEVVRAFRAWCGPEARLISWGNSDISVLTSNLRRFGLPEDWPHEVYDLQAAYGYLTGDALKQLGLKDLVEHYEISAPEEFHDARNDAMYTALCGIAMVKEFGGLPEWSVVESNRERVRAEHAALAAARAQEAALAALATAPRLSQRQFEVPDPVEELLGQRAPLVWTCPECGAKLKGEDWCPFGEGQITRGRCGEHGWYYYYLSLHPQVTDIPAGTELLFAPAAPMKSAYFRNHRLDRKKRPHPSVRRPRPEACPPAPAAR